MKVFISWSKDFSKDVAIALRDWLPKTLQSVEPYVSSEDIEKGSRWHMDISKRLDETAFGIICLTKENASSPWINFEAGALGKCVDNSKVCPLLIDMVPSDVQGPISSFQTTNVGDKEDFFKLLSSINASSPSPVKEDVLTDVFDVWWPKLSEKISEIVTQYESAKPKKGSGKAVAENSTEKESKILEELLAISRNNFQLLRDPRNILPEEYVSVVLERFSSKENKEHALSAMPAVISDLSRVNRRLVSLRRRISRDSDGVIVGFESISERQDEYVPTDVQAELESIISQLRDPLGFLIRHFDSDK
ncbi:TIR domain-containing protein [Cronobacter sakazakii]|uniref:toll/interleukin-1 receptor domain-containing protein n=1 Tax=Cronobacter sakazakii TaxID=28141 RepID=UPI001412BB83|nr:toll/interleukin-1 receptor domain-containing protein [Cronobacter sakazakii]NHV14374.1 TIR domain-containing protein [Cronobacter sakazakii]